MKKLVSAAIVCGVSFVLLTTPGGTPMIPREVPPFDYASFIGVWERVEDGEIYAFNRRINILNVTGDRISFDIEQPGGIENHHELIVNNQVRWGFNEGTNRERLFTMTFYHDSIRLSTNFPLWMCWNTGVEHFEERYTSDTAITRRITAGDFFVTLNGQRIVFDQNPVMVNNRILVPVRGIIEALGGHIGFERDTSESFSTFGFTTEEVITIPAFVNDMELRLSRVSVFQQAERYGNMWGGYQSWGGFKLVDDTIVSRFYFDEYDDVPPVIINNRTLVPIRIIAENLGVEVNWDGETQSVRITTTE